VGVDEELQSVEEPGGRLRPDQPPPASGGRDAEADLRGEKRENATCASTTDPDAKLYRKGPGTEAKLAFLGRALTAMPRASASASASRKASAG
jgi:hypothetical protein